jgi:hypothetical protein
MTRLSRLIFGNAEIRFFDKTKCEQAWEWIEEGLSTKLSRGSSSSI